MKAANRIARFVRREALALFLHVDFTPYGTTFKLAECEGGEDRWSRR